MRTAHLYLYLSRIHQISHKLNIITLDKLFLFSPFASQHLDFEFITRIKILIALVCFLCYNCNITIMLSYILFSFNMTMKYFDKPWC